MHKGKVFLTLVASSSLVVVAVTGCGSGGSASVSSSNASATGNASTNNSGNSNNSSASNKHITITFWYENGGPNRDPYFKHLIAEFEKKNPNITVDYVGLPESSAQQKYDTAIGGGGTPDVGGVAPGMMADFVGKGALLPLDSYFNSWSEKSQMASSAISAMRGYAPDGKLYALPFTTMIDGFWYNAPWFKKQNASPPTTWSNFFTAAKKLTDASNSKYGFEIRGGSGGLIELLSMMYSYSGVTKMFDANGKSTINDPKNVEFVKKFIAMFGKDTPTSDVNLQYQPMVAEFDNGAVAMMEHNIGNGSQTKKVMGSAGQFVPLPAPGMNGKGKLTIMGGGYDSYGIFKGSKHPNADWKFISFMASASSQSYWNQQVGQLPTNSSVMKASWIKTEPWITAAFKAINDPNSVIVNPPQYLPTYQSSMDNTLQPEFQKVLLGKVSVQKFMNDWANNWTQAEAKWKKTHSSQ